MALFRRKKSSLFFVQYNTNNCSFTVRIIRILRIVCIDPAFMRLFGNCWRDLQKKIFCVSIFSHASHIAVGACGSILAAGDGGNCRSGAGRGASSTKFSLKRLPFPPLSIPPLTPHEYPHLFVLYIFKLSDNSRMCQPIGFGMGGSTGGIPSGF